ncbi:PilZ domain-containing protein [Candidatus Magnetaquicoccus inordinatus]|uniref:PilZ domain-containing protein n=1 Tax=Candidatus Magnetaquicoccus inordinatus TaxID=2496818 RepID=UPI00102AC790|nr:PilZ domain-containing protein [Candidatus Magnetaquicoccus inordinatus]
MNTHSLWQQLSSAMSRLTGHGQPRHPNASSSRDGDRSAQSELLQNKTKIAELLMQASDAHTELHISFGSRVLEYKTRILPDKEMIHAGATALSSEYLRNHTHLLLGCTDPADGNDKIHLGRMGVVTFILGGKLHEFKTMRLPSDTPSPGNAHRMQFPEQMSRKALRRDAARIPYQPASGVSLRLVDEDGSSFEAIILDISMGGCRFLLPHDQSPPAEGSQVRFFFQWRDDQELVQQGTLFKVQYRQGEIVGHAGFHADNYEAIRMIGELVTHVERINLRLRHNLSPTETENIADLFQSAHLDTIAHELEARSNRVR